MRIGNIQIEKLFHYVIFHSKTQDFDVKSLNIKIVNNLFLEFIF